jgi:hypothetical protein
MRCRSCDSFAMRRTTHVDTERFEKTSGNYTTKEKPRRDGRGSLLPSGFLTGDDDVFLPNIQVTMYHVLMVKCDDDEAGRVQTRRHQC